MRVFELMFELKVTFVNSNIFGVNFEKIDVDKTLSNT